MKTKCSSYFRLEWYTSKSIITTNRSINSTNTLSILPGTCSLEELNRSENIEPKVVPLRWDCSFILSCHASWAHEVKESSVDDTYNRIDCFVFALRSSPPLTLALPSRLRRRKTRTKTNNWRHRMWRLRSSSRLLPNRPELHRHQVASSL